MKARRLLIAITLAIVFVTPASAGFKGFLKKMVAPTPLPVSSGAPASPQPTPTTPAPSRTESLIFGGLSTLKSLQPLGYQEEMAIGGAVALEAVARFGGLVENLPLEKYVAKVGTAVAQTSDRADIPYSFGILNIDEPNAFAAPGGYVFVSKGLLKMLQSEAELAGVLGHEVAHVAKRHALETIRKTQLLSNVSQVTLAALDKDPKMFDSVVKETTTMLFERGLDRTKELEADEIGTDYAFRVGYNPNGLRTFLQILNSSPAQAKGGGLFKTHPATSDRLHLLDSILARPEYATSTGLPNLKERLNQLFATAKF